VANPLSAHTTPPHEPTEQPGKLAEKRHEAEEKAEIDIKRGPLQIKKIPGHPAARC
jgi:hypothetical protein